MLFWHFCESFCVLLSICFSSINCLFTSLANIFSWFHFFILIIGTFYIKWTLTLLLFDNKLSDSMCFSLFFEIPPFYSTQSVTHIILDSTSGLLICLLLLWHHPDYHNFTVYLTICHIPLPWFLFQTTSGNYWALFFWTNLKLSFQSFMKNYTVIGF